MNAIRVMTVVFNTPLKQSEIRKFRGAVIQAAGEENTLFHNHNGHGFNYRYPFIQYRIIGGKAAIVCLNEGIEQAQALFANGFVGRELILGNENRGTIAIDSIRQQEFSLQTLDIPIAYRITRWLPLNQQNYKAWRQIENEEERIAKLNAILIGNIISFAKGIGWQIDAPLRCAIDASSITTRQIQYKGQSLISFSLTYSLNIFFPIGLGLGKGVSSNCGVVLRTTPPIRTLTSE